MEFMNGPHWTPEHRALWQRIAAHPFEAPGTALDFLRRLARDRAWPLDHARAAMEEYRRFCFLSVVQPTPVTPSLDVDEVWHQHLAYSRDYWDAWCGQVLQRRLHHDPTEGGPSEDRKFREQYAQTLRTYEAWFGAPPAALWPSTRQRFARRPRFRTIDTARVIAIPRPRLPTRWALGLAAFLAIPATAMAESDNPLDWSGESFLTLFVLLLIGAGAFTLLGRWLIRGTGPAVQGPALSAVETAFLAGGPNRAFATAMLEAMAGGNVTIDAKGVVSVDAPHRVTGPLARFLTNGATYRDVRRAAEPPLTGLRQTLEQRGLILSKPRAFCAGLIGVILLGPVALLGAEKIHIGLERGRPVGFLIVPVIVAAIAMVIGMRRRPTRSRSGDALLAEMRRKMARLTRAPTEDELPLALALVGTAVLVGTSYAALGAPSRQAGADGGSGCGSNSCGGGGGGDSGGGGGDSGGSSGCGGCSSSSC
jgi:uncharacterized protein (TIGR04222 family)